MAAVKPQALVSVYGPIADENGSETEPLLSSRSTAVQEQDETSNDNGETFDNVPKVKRQLGLPSAVFLIFNRVIGTGIYATPSVILRSAGSVGVAFVLWLIGALVAAAGTAVYIELGTGLPRSGGEKTYLEFIYRRPEFLVTCIVASYAVLIGSSAANSVVFGEYTVHALGLPVTELSVRSSALAGLTFTLVMHGCFLTWGLRLQNTLGFFKFFVLLAIALVGALSMAGVPGFRIRDGCEVPHNFEWHNLWEGSNLGANSLITGLYSVIWSFIGYSNANYALSETRNPVRTLKRAAPLAMISVTAVYFFVNVAYLAVVSRNDILGSGTIIAALFFRNIFGPTTERILSAIIALSTLGNMLAVLFSQGRVVQELGREGILPFSEFFASNRPFSAPLAGIFAQWVASAVYMLAPPPGDAYLFMLNLSSYPYSLMNSFVSGGLLLLHTARFKAWGWDPPFKAHRTATWFFFLSNLFLVFVPLVPPVPGVRLYEHLPYWLHVLVAVSVSIIGIAYWYVFCKLLPSRGHYSLVRLLVLQDDGVSRNVFRKVLL